MDSKRLVTFAVIAFAILFGWQKLFPAPKPVQTQHAVQQQQAVAAKAEAALTAAVPITVTTDTVKAVIDEKSGDLRRLTLLKYKASGDANKDFVLFDDGKDHTYVAQAELLDAQGNNVLKNVGFTAPQKQYTLNGDKTEVRLSAEADGLKIDKVYTFTKGSYLINVRFDVTDAGGKASVSMNLYAGPQTTSVLAGIADKLQLAKDYGKVHWFASPLFWLLNKLHELIGNWGWSIIALTIIVKAVLYPLTNASYRSMAKMRAVAPKLQAIKEKYGDDRMAQQQAMMQMYKDEKINPLGGCLPMLLQIPVFIGLYWALFASVELRQAPWLGWITDLSRPDPFYILIMAGTMFAQTFLNPPPTDPMQAKMMKIMPMVFSVMFFFFPAGLVLYWVVNNLLTIAQQWYINRNIEKQRTQGEVVS